MSTAKSKTPPTATGRFDVLVTTPEGVHLVGPFSRQTRAEIAAARIEEYAALGKLKLTTSVVPLQGAFAPGQTTEFLEHLAPGAAKRIEAARAAAKKPAAKKPAAKTTSRKPAKSAAKPGGR